MAAPPGQFLALQAINAPRETVSGMLLSYYWLKPGADPGFGKGGDPASEAESCRRIGAELCEQSKLSAAGVQGLLKDPGRFWVFNAQICILPHSRDYFSLISNIYIKTKNFTKWEMIYRAKWGWKIFEF